MRTIMTLKHVNTIEAVKAFLVGNQDVIFAVADNKEQRYTQSVFKLGVES